MKFGIVVLVNNDVHSVFEVIENGQNQSALNSIREQVKELNLPGRTDEVKSIRIQRCTIETVKDERGDGLETVETIIDSIKNSFL